MNHKQVIELAKIVGFKVAKFTGGPKAGKESVFDSGDARGRITDVFGALCAVPDMVSEEGRRKAVFFDGGHGVCEMHEFRAPNG